MIKLRSILMMLKFAQSLRNNCVVKFWNFDIWGVSCGQLVNVLFIKFQLLSKGFDYFRRGDFVILSSC